MITCILVGGNSKRFTDAGYLLHKAILPTRGKRIVFDDLLDNLPVGNGKLVIAARAVHKQAISIALINSVICNERADIEQTTIVWSNSVARGPIYGILDASEYLDVDEPVVVSYCDCWVRGGIDSLVKEWSKYESGAVVFASYNPRFGYWSGRTNKVMSYAEAVSSLAVSGLFYFHNGRKLVERAFEIARPGVGVVNLIDIGTKLIAVDSDHLIDIGAPDAYEAYLKHG